MKITIEVEPVILPCQHGQEDGTTTYYGFRIMGLAGKYDPELVMRSSEGSYPGNDALREFINSRSVG